MWRNKITFIANTNKHIIMMPPASNDDIITLTSTLGDIPESLIVFLLEINGDCYFFLSVEQIIETNLLLRSIDTYMPLDCLLFFATNGCGDYFGYQIRKNGINANRIYFWDHESDNRIYVASSLEEVFDRYFKNEI